jgi:hypothetical protein
MTPPTALICSTARSMAWRTVTSEIAIVPDSEFSEPTLTVDPDVSTHDAAFAESDSVALLPQPASTRLVAATTLPAARTDLLNEERRGSRMYGLSSMSAALSAC